jgi:hypothetical protein
MFNMWELEERLKNLTETEMAALSVASRSQS